MISKDEKSKAYEAGILAGFRMASQTARVAAMSIRGMAGGENGAAALEGLAEALDVSAQGDAALAALKYRLDEADAGKKVE